MNRLERIHKIDEMINRHGTVPVDVFLSTLKISLATFKRDLDYLRTSLHSPVVWDRSRGGYSYGRRRGKAPASTVPTLWASARDTQALLSAHAALAAVRSGPLRAESEGLAARVLTLLAAHGDTPAHILKRLTVAAASPAASDHPLFPALANAVLKRRRIRMECRTGRRRSLEALLLSPQSLHFSANGWVLDANLQADGRSVQIALDDCESVEVLNEKARDGSGRGVKR